MMRGGNVDICIALKRPALSKPTRYSYRPNICLQRATHTFCIQIRLEKFRRCIVQVALKSISKLESSVGVISICISKRQTTASKL
jgi:hypothetical protein